MDKKKPNTQFSFFVALTLKSGIVMSMYHRCLTMVYYIRKHHRDRREWEELWGEGS